MFSVGLVGPLGYGPLSGGIKQISTSGNSKAPPKKLSVTSEGGDPLKMRIQWIPPCPSIQPDSYIVSVCLNCISFQEFI